MNIKCSVQVQVPDFKFLQVGGGIVASIYKKREAAERRGLRLQAEDFFDLCHKMESGRIQHTTQHNNHHWWWRNLAKPVDTVIRLSDY